MSEDGAEGASLGALVEIMRRLLGPGGCPWDRKQSHASLRPYLIEEAYEVLEAIDAEEPEALCEELGDLLLQIVFHAELARDRGAFTIEDVVDAICQKLIRRHPHVFSDAPEASTPGEVEVRWEQLKRAEGRRRACGGVPRSLPALRRGQRLGERLGHVGFDWPDVEGPRAKLDEEMAELDEAIASGERGQIEAELGDLLFSAVNLARHLGVDAEDALRGTLDRFEGRFEVVEDRLLDQGRRPEDCTLDELEALWQAVKDQLHPPLDR